MTKKERLVVSRRLWHGGRFFEAGTRLADIDPAPTDEQLRLYTDRNAPFIEDADVIEERQNADAFRARRQVEAATGELQAVYAALGENVTTPDGAIAAIEDLRQRGATDQADLAAAKVFNQGLRTLYPQAKTAKDLLKAAQESHAGSAGLIQERDDLRTQLETATARIAALEKVHAVEGGTELPQNFTGRGRLTQLGLTTYESLRGKTAAQLNAVEGLTPDHAAKIVEAVEKHFAEAE